MRSFLKCPTQRGKVSPGAISVIIAASAVFAALAPAPAHAVPSFARQTGVACEACHTQFPELTPFGRDFKLNGYILQTAKEISATGENKEKTLTLADLPPISFMFTVSSTSTNKSVPDSMIAGEKSQNGQVAFPQEAAFFYAGKIAPHLGAFVQFTYSGVEDVFGIDNADIRFANTGTIGSSDIVYGLSLNNNPTVQDIYNTVPAWGFPFFGSDTAPAPAAATIIDGGLGGDVAGLSAYFSINRMFYGEAGVYRTARLGATAPLDSTQSNVIQGVAPYWRFAYERRWGQNSWSAGTFGTHVVLRPGFNGAINFPVTSGPEDFFTDAALDTQYQFIGDRDIVTVAALWIHENAERDGSVFTGLASTRDSVLNTVRATASYLYDRTIGGSLQFFSTSGDSDPLLYGSGTAVTGSLSGSPNSNGEVLEVDYLPWLNTKLSVQYVIYNKFNGASSNYDGFGRNASDNDTLFLNFWYAF